MSARDRILERVRDATSRREAVPHPGAFYGWRPKPDSAAVGTAEAFASLFEAAGGEVVRVPDVDAGARWLADFASDFETVSCGEGVPAELRPDLPAEPPSEAELGISMAREAIAETGSLVMDARDGRRAQLLTPVHVVFVDTATIQGPFREALIELGRDLPSAVGFHSGPSKSADIGQIMVKGVHGPGRVVAVLVG